jgi:hypothetical protein
MFLHAAACAVELEGHASLRADSEQMPIWNQIAQASVTD